MGKKSRIDGILSLQIGKKTNRWDFIFTDWKENKSMGFYLYRLKKNRFKDKIIFRDYKIRDKGEFNLFR
jgi:hypothetical protein